MNEQQLKDLIEKYLDGRATVDEQRKVEQWYAAFEENDATFYGGDRDKIAASARNSFAIIKHKLAGETVVLPITSGRRFLWERIAAGFALLLSAGAMTYYLIRPQQAVSLTVVKNEGGKVKQVILPDSSLVWLNSRSEIQYLPGFTRDSRQVFLSGEAFFEVRPDYKRPFSVHSHGIATHVLGTSFNVNAYEELDTMAITLLTGKVQVASGKVVLGTLEPEQQLSYHRSSGKAITTRVSASALAAWKDGRLQFDDYSMEQIASTLERWYGYKVVFANVQLKKCRYSATFDNTITLKALLEILREVSNVQYDLDDAHKLITFKGRDCNN
jgi:transmembrane sensor